MVALASPYASLSPPLIQMLMPQLSVQSVAKCMALLKYKMHKTACARHVLTTGVAQLTRNLGILVTGFAEEAEQFTFLLHIHLQFFLCL